MLELLAPIPPSVAPTAGDVHLPGWLWAVVVVLVVVGLGLLVAALRRGRASLEVPCRNCGKILMASWSECLFCKTPRNFRRAELTFVAGPLIGRSVALDGEVTTLGSAPGSTVLLEDGAVSRKHAGIRKVGGGYELADLGSTNGVYVNGERVARRQLQVGDVIRVGTTEMVFKM